MLLALIISMLSIGRATAKKHAQVVWDKAYTLTFYYDEELHTEGVLYIINGETSWINENTKEKVQKVVFDESFRDYRPTSTAGWFKDLIWLSSTSGMKDNLNTSEVTDMSYMFYRNYVEAIDFTSFENFNTSKVEKMDYMFAECRRLYSVNISTFDTRNVKSMKGMFCCIGGAGYYESSLTSVDLGGFNTSKVTDMSFMFCGCDKLERIFVGKDWTTNAVTYSNNMFGDCESLIGGEGTTFDPEHTDAAYARIDGGKFKSGYLSCKGLPYATLNDGTLIFRMDNDRYNLSFKTYGLKDDDSFPGWWNDKETVVSVMFAPSFANARPTSTYYWFANMENLRVITGMDEYLNTSEVTNMKGMFNYCKSLESIDLSGFNTAKVTDMAQMFKDCDKVTTLDLRSFNTYEVTDMSAMFLDCDALTTIYAGYFWNTEKVTESTNMFLFSSNIVGGMGTRYNSDHRDVSYAHNDNGESDPGYLTQIIAYAMLDGQTLTFCYDNLFFTREGTPYGVEDLGIVAASFYHELDEVTTAVFDPSFAAYRPILTTGWFSNLPKLTEIKGMREYLNTSEVINMSGMFNGSPLLKTLDLSGFDTHKVESMYRMFYGCTSLTTILVGDGWSTENVISSDEMFTDCTSLVGCAGTKYDASHTDAAYAHVDGGTSNPGYLSDRIAYVVYDNGTLTFYDDKEFGNRAGTVYEVNTGVEKPGWLTDATCYDVITVVFDPSFANYTPTTMIYWFNNMESLTEIKGMKEYLNTAYVESMYDTFNGCRSMEVLDLSAFETSRVSNMYRMFANCTSLTTIMVGDGWKLRSNLFSTDMFSNCRKLVGMAGTTYDKNHIDKAYAHPDGGEANPGYLSSRMMYVAVEGETMKFYYDGNFYTRTEPVYKPDQLWTASANEHAFDQVVIAEFDPSFADARPTSTSGWFVDMPKLSTFKGMKEYLNTSEVRTMRSMFNHLLYVEKLDLSGFDTHNVQDMSYMFALNTYLETIWVGDGWNTDNVTESTGMFSSCRRLVGGAGTKWDEGHTDVSYAHVDGGEANPGYFTNALQKGDVNSDGKVDIVDVTMTISHILGQKPTGFNNAAADVTGDGKIDIVDVTSIIDMILKK